MSNNTPRFDLVDIAKVLQKRSRFILLITLATTIVGAVLHFALPKKYEATTELFVANPLYTDRSNIFRNRNAEFINYFGNEDDIDKVIAMAESDLARKTILDKQDLAKVYGLDTSKKEDRMKLAGIFKKGFKVTRTEYQGMRMSYTDKDPVIAANVANEAVAVTEAMYKDFYNQLKKNVVQSLNKKITETDSAINALSGTLATAPAGSVQAQTITATKDQLIIDRSKDVSLLNEFNTGLGNGEMSLLRVISTASPATEPKGLGLTYTLIACALIGAFFSAVWVLISSYYKMLTSVER